MRRVLPFRSVFLGSILRLNGDTTHCITTFSITIRIATLSITKLSIMALNTVMLSVYAESLF
jgi:hypothetical protein